MTAPVEWLAEHVEDGAPRFRIGRAKDVLVAEWEGLAELRARRDGSDVRFAAAPGIDTPTLLKIERGAARLLLRQLEGRLSLHGAAFASEEKAVVLLGRSGSGKSTLVAELAARDGVAFYADDAVAVDPTADGYSLTRLDDYCWLEPEPGAPKVPHRPTNLGAGAPRVIAVVELAFADVPAPRLVRVHGVDAVAALVPQLVRFVLDEPEVQRRELDAVAALVDSVPVHRLLRRKDIGALPATGDAIVGFFHGGERKSA